MKPGQSMPTPTGLGVFEDYDEKVWNDAQELEEVPISEEAGNDHEPQETSVFSRAWHWLVDEQYESVIENPVEPQENPVKPSSLGISGPGAANATDGGEVVLPKKEIHIEPEDSLPVITGLNYNYSSDQEEETTGLLASISGALKTISHVIHELIWPDADDNKELDSDNEFIGSFNLRHRRAMERERISKEKMQKAEEQRIFDEETKRRREAVEWREINYVNEWDKAEESLANYLDSKALGILKKSVLDNFGEATHEAVLLSQKEHERAEARRHNTSEYWIEEKPAKEVKQTSWGSWLPWSPKESQGIELVNMEGVDKTKYLKEVELELMGHHNTGLKAQSYQDAESSAQSEFIEEELIEFNKDLTKPGHLLNEDIPEPVDPEFSRKKEPTSDMDVYRDAILDPLHPGTGDGYRLAIRDPIAYRQFLGEHNMKSSFQDDGVSEAGDEEDTVPANERSINFRKQIAQYNPAAKDMILPELNMDDVYVANAQDYRERFESASSSGEDTDAQFENPYSTDAYKDPEDEFLGNALAKNSILELQEKQKKFDAMQSTFDQLLKDNPI